MADKKISQLTPATTPLAGTEELPIVQGGSTVKVSVNNLTAGKPVTASQLTVENNSSSDAVRITQTGAGNALVVEDSANPDATPFVVNNNGNVGIGRTPSSTLNILGNTNPSVDIDYYETGTGAASYRGRKARGTVASPTAVAANDYISTFLAAGYGDTSFSGNIGLIGFRANQTFTDAARGTNIVFENTPDGTNSRAERMRITSAGNVGIGTSSPNAAARLDVSSTTSGFLPPRMTEAQRDLIATPPDGLVLYNTTTNKLQVRAAGAWVDLH